MIWTGSKDCGTRHQAGGCHQNKATFDRICHEKKKHKTYQSKYKSGRNFEKKKKERRHHTWLHSDTEFPSGSRALAFSKISSNLSKLVPGLFQNFFKIRPDCYQASPTIARGPSTKCFKFQNFSDLFSIFVATCYLKSTSWIGLPPPIPCTFWSVP